MRDRREALHYLTTLNDKQFAELFYEAVAGRNTSDSRRWGGHFVLADAEKVDGEPWAVDFIALSADAAVWGDDAPICQSGTCTGCGSPVRSWSKQARCPVCGAQIYCT